MNQPGNVRGAQLEIAQDQHKLSESARTPRTHCQVLHLAKLKPLKDPQPIKAQSKVM